MRKKQKLICKVKKHLGEPTLFINDKPTVPFMFYGYAAQIGTDNCFINQAKLAKKAGVRIYSIPVEFIWKTNEEKPIYSTLHNILDKNPYEQVDRVFRNIIKIDSKALILPRFYLHPPKWWLEKYPNEKMSFSDGKKERISIASSKWKAFVKYSLIEFVNHCEKQFGEHIIGYHPALLTTDEFFYERAWEPVFYGFEEPLQRGYINWLKKKYKTIEALRIAWNTKKLSFDEISLPSVEERKNTNGDFFRHPLKDKAIIDFYEYKNSLVANTIKFFAKIIKKVTNKNKLFVSFYGYTFELAAIPNGIQTSGHLKLKEVIKCRNVDAICSPISYFDRGKGGIGAFMAPVDSIRHAGKLWINEDDTRTHLCNLPGQETFGTVKSLDETLGVHRRNFARIFPRRMGTWYMDLLNRRWLDSNEIWEHIAKLKTIYQNNLNTKTSFHPEVSIIIDERSPLFLACNNILTLPLYYVLRAQLYRMGSSFNLILLSDVLEGKVKLSKVNIFLGAWYLEKTEREKLISNLKNKTAVWFYGAGYIDESGKSKNNMSKLTGFSFTELNNRTPKIKFLKNNEWNYQLTGKSFQPLVNTVINGDNTFQTINQNAKSYKRIWAINKNKNIIPLAKFDSEHIALAITNKLGYQSIYSGIPALPARFFKNVLKNSGIQLYLESYEIMEADDNFLAIGVSNEKSEKINIGNNKYLVNILNGKKSFPKDGIVEEHFKSGETKLYWKNNILKQKNNTN